MQFIVIGYALLYEAGKNADDWALRSESNAIFSLPVFDGANPDVLYAINLKTWHLGTETHNNYFIAVSKDGGQHWQNVFDNDLYPIYQLAIIAGKGGELYALMDDAIHYSSDGGGHWTAIPNGQKRFTTFTASPFSADRLYVGSSNGLYCVSNCGRQWQSLGLDQEIDQIVCQPQDADFLFVKTEAGLYISRDGGKTWTSVFNLHPPGVELTSLQQVTYAFASLPSTIADWGVIEDPENTILVEVAYSGESGIKFLDFGFNPDWNFEIADPPPQKFHFKWDTSSVTWEVGYQLSAVVFDGNGIYGRCSTFVQLESERPEMRLSAKIAMDRGWLVRRPYAKLTFHFDHRLNWSHYSSLFEFALCRREAPGDYIELKRYRASDESDFSFDYADMGVKPNRTYVYKVVAYSIYEPIFNLGRSNRVEVH